MPDDGPPVYPSTSKGILSFDLSVPVIHPMRNKIYVSPGKAKATIPRRFITGLYEPGGTECGDSCGDCSGPASSLLVAGCLDLHITQVRRCKMCLSLFLSSHQQTAVWCCSCGLPVEAWRIAKDVNGHYERA